MAQVENFKYIPENGFRYVVFFLQHVTSMLFFANQRKGCKEGQLHNLISLTPHVGLCPTDGENVDL